METNIENLGKKEKNLLLFGLCVAMFIFKAAFSVLTPFYEDVATEKGVSKPVYTLLLSILALVGVIFSPIFGIYTPSLGTKKTFMIGTVTSGIFSILFGLTDRFQTEGFVAASFIFRIVQSIGIAAAECSATIILFIAFPKNISSAFGLTKVFSGLGLIVGPTLGGFLYLMGGYGLPFYVLGVVLFAIVPISYYLLPASIDCFTVPGSWKLFIKVIFLPGIVINFIARVSSGMEITYLDSTLDSFLESIDISNIHTISILFLVEGIGYALSAPIWGIIGEKYKIEKQLQILGLAVGGLSCIFIGINVNGDSWLWCGGISIAIMGISIGSSALLLHSMKEAACENGIEDSAQIDGIITGIFYTAYNFGMLCGPAVGSAVYQVSGFQLASAAIAIIVFISCLLYIFYFVYYRFWGKYAIEKKRKLPSLSDSKMIELESKLLYEADQMVEKEETAMLQPGSSTPILIGPKYSSFNSLL